MNRKTVTLAGAIFTLILLLIPVTSIINSFRLKSKGKAAVGTVQTVSAQRRGLPRVTVSFSDDEGRQFTSTASKRNRVVTGEKVELWYDPARPDKITLGDTTGYNLKGVVLISIVFLFLAGYFIRFSLTDRTKKLLMKSGRKVQAEIAAVERNEKFRMGPNNPWVIKCRWKDPYSDRELLFYSRDYTIDPAPYIEGRQYLDVYIDLKNSGKYYMDVTFMPAGNNTIG